jgi:hypothetical protein
MGLHRTLRKLRIAYDTLRDVEARLGRSALIASHAHHSTALATFPQYQDVLHLARYGEKIYSQNDQDGIVREIFRRIGTRTRFFVEFGVGNGMENNTLALLLEGWSGAWMEADQRLATAIRDSFASLPDRRLRFKCTTVTAETIESLLSELDVPDEPDLLSIDIDGNDYWVWKAINRYRPLVVVAEYNGGLGRTADVKQAYDPTFRWDYSRAYGASLKALENLGRDKGYVLVGCNFTGGNAFFVRADTARDLFLEPFTAEKHFEPPKHFLRLSTGHPVSPREIPLFFKTP